MTLKLRHQVFLSIFAVAGSLILLLGIVSAFRAATIVREQTSLAIQDALHQATINIDNVLGETRIVADGVGTNPQLSDLLRNVKHDSYDLGYLLDGFRNAVRVLTIAEANEHIHRIRLFLYGDSLLGRNRRFLYNISDWQDHLLFLGDGASTVHRWIPTYETVYPFASTPTPVVSLRQTVWGGPGLQDSVGILIVDIHRSVFVDVLQDVSRFSEGTLVLFENESVIASTALGGDLLSDPLDLVPSFLQDASPGSIELVDYNGERSIAIVQTVVEPFTDWRLAAIIPERTVSGRSRQIYLFAAVLIVCAVVISGVVAGLLSGSITRELTVLSHRIRGVKRGNYERIPEINGPIEIRAVQQQFNEMADEIHRLVEQVLRNQLRRQSAEFRVLQAQIDPHFLYNTLDTIKWMGRRNQGTEIVEMIDALSSFFRLSLNQGAVIVALRDEIAHVRAYLTIQDYRFRDRLRVEYVIDEEVQELRVLKLVLQPVVENAIVHGIQKKPDRSGTIRISARLSGDGNPSIVFSVTDDGVGMNTDQMKGILRGKTSGYALHNIQRRIQLYYGPAYGLSVDSAAGIGTTVDIRLPLDADASLQLPLEDTAVLDE